MSDHEYGIQKLGNYYNHHHVTYGGKRIGTVIGYDRSGGEKFTGTFDRKNAKGLHSPIAKHEFDSKEDAMKWVVDQHKSVHEETATNNMGAGQIAKFDPKMEFDAKEVAKKALGRRKKPVEIEMKEERDLDSKWDDEDEEEPDKKKKKKDEDEDDLDESETLTNLELQFLAEAFDLVEAKGADRYPKPSLNLGAVVAAIPTVKASAPPKKAAKKNAAKKPKPVATSAKVDSTPPAREEPQKPVETPVQASKPVSNAPQSVPQPVTALDHIDRYWETGKDEHYKSAQAAIGQSVARMRDDKFHNPLDIVRHELALTASLKKAHATHNPPPKGIFNKAKKIFGLGEDTSYEEFVDLMVDALTDNELDKYLSEQLVMKVKQKTIK